MTAPTEPLPLNVGLTEVYEHLDELYALHGVSAFFGDGINDDRDLLASADAALGSGEALILAPGTYLVNSNLTLTHVVLFRPGAKLKPASGVTITLNGGYEAGVAQHVFDISAGGAMAGLKKGRKYVTPLHFGATGDGVAIDTTTLAAAVATKLCFLPPGYEFLTTVPVQVPDQGALWGAGRESFIKGSAVSGGVVQIGTGNPTTVRQCVVKHFRIIGTATNALKVNYATGIWLENVSADGDQGKTATWIDAYKFDYAFANYTLSGLATNGATVGGSVTFTASVGGATSGTLTASKTDGVYNFRFSNGENRKVTIASGTSVTWSVALLAGTITTAKYGSSYWVGGAFNANVCNSWYSSGTGPAYNLYLSDDNSVGTSAGNTFNNPTAQGGQVGVYVGKNWLANTFNGYYAEAVGTPIQLGDSRTGATCFATTFNSPIIPGPTLSDGYSVGIHCSSAHGTVINAPLADFYQYAASFAPVTITRGGGDSTGVRALGICLVSHTGVVKSCALVRHGAGYTETPTISIGGSGSGATATATFEAVAAFTGSISGTTLTVSSLTSGKIYPGVTLTGGTVVAGTFVTDFISGSGGDGTYVVSTSQTQTCTGASAITALTLTAGGTGYGTGYIPILVGGGGSGLTIVGPFSRASEAGAVNQLWPLIALDSSSTFGQVGVTILGETDTGFGSDAAGGGNTLPVSLTTTRAYGRPPGLKLGITYDFGRGCILYKTHTVPTYP